MKFRSKRNTDEAEAVGCSEEREILRFKMKKCHLVACSFIDATSHLIEWGESF